VLNAPTYWSTGNQRSRMAFEGSWVLWGCCSEVVPREQDEVFYRVVSRRAGWRAGQARSQLSLAQG